ncbi:VOC family protein [Affinibrenneria salicis]|uniref:VOC family protein n=1 Tax=Affinibrenneria salicis TaxID=2590031 RepID=A0A5J5G3S4_9GAMM|nr:VOC family protein [Affinibrenneria salicis]KAA9001668.1 VOC family protein [Affinibrenneria salicis]
MSNRQELALSPALSADLRRFEQQLLALATRLGISLADFNADHISLRCHQYSTAEQWRQQLSLLGECLSEKTINGRPICLFELRRPLVVGPLHISCVELPWPGKKHYPHEGWQHIELVLDGDPQTLHQRALDCLSDEALRAPDISLKCSAPRGENERLANPTLAVTDGKAEIKFHPYDIRAVIASERAS